MAWDDFGFEIGDDYADPYAGYGDVGDYYSFDMPDYSGYEIYDQGFGQPFASAGGGFTFDTTTGQVLLPGGQPMPDFTKMPDQINAPGTGTGTYVTQGGQPGESPGMLDRIGGLVGPAAGAVNKALETPLGRAAGAAGVGLLGLGAQRLFAGADPTYKPPTYTPGPVAAAGQNALLASMQAQGGQPLQRAATGAIEGQAGIAEQVNARIPREIGAEAAAAPYEATARQTALQDVNRLMVPEQDPIREGMRRELLAVLTGQSSGVSPMTAQRQQKEEQEIRARLYRQLGQDYELTTPGQDALNKMKQRFNSETYNERLATINSLNAPELARTGSNESVRRNQLSDATNLSTFGLRGVPQNQTALSQIVPVQGLFGNGEQANQINTQLQADAARTAYAADVARQQQMAKGIGDVAGAAAGALTARRSPLEDYFAKAYGS